MVPSGLQPTYMAFVQFFWQLYLSSSEEEFKDANDGELQKIFNEIDSDRVFFIVIYSIDTFVLTYITLIMKYCQSGYLDASELKSALEVRGEKVSDDDIAKMIADADSMDSDTVEEDGKVSFDEFKKLYSSGSAIKTAGLWASVRKDVKLQKGAKAVIQRIAEVDKSAAAKDKDAILKLESTISSSETCPVSQENSTAQLEMAALNQERNEAMKCAGYSGMFLFIAAAMRKLVLKI